MGKKTEKKPEIRMKLVECGSGKSAEAGAPHFKLELSGFLSSALKI